MIANYASNQAKFDRHVLTNLMKFELSKNLHLPNAFEIRAKNNDLIKVQDRGSPEMIFI